MTLGIAAPPLPASTARLDNCRARLAREHQRPRCRHDRSRRRNDRPERLRSRLLRPLRAERPRPRRSGSFASPPTRPARSGDRRPLRACARGRSYRQRVYHPDRLLHPLIRVGERGEGHFREATWDEALDLTRGGDPASPGPPRAGGALRPRRLGPQGLLRGDASPRACSACPAASSATTATTASPARALASRHLRHRRDRQLLGRPRELAADPPLVGEPGRHADRQRRPRSSPARGSAGARIVVIDPIYTDTAASFADEWIPIYPGPTRR